MIEDKGTHDIIQARDQRGNHHVLVKKLWCTMIPAAILLVQ